jgi:hypothetical protein
MRLNGLDGRATVPLYGIMMASKSDSESAEVADHIMIVTLYIVLVGLLNFSQSISFKSIGTGWTVIEQKIQS